jgi:hypothetical protein
MRRRIQSESMSRHNRLQLSNKTPINLQLVINEVSTENTYVQSPKALCKFNYLKIYIEESKEVFDE